MATSSHQVYTPPDFPGTFLADLESATMGRAGSKRGHEIRFRCPFPERHRNGDADPSARYNTVKMTWNCDICEGKGGALDLATRLGVTKPERRQEPPVTPLRRVVATYDFHDANGELLFQVVRYEPKSFSQRRPDGKGGWIHNLQGIEPPLYRLPEVLADTGEWIPYVEGEKDADRLVAAGWNATTSPMGAGKWRDSYTESLRGKGVALIPDSDPAGVAHALKVARSISEVVDDLAILRLKHHKDVSDWLDAGGDAADIDRVLNGGASPFIERITVAELEAWAAELRGETTESAEPTPNAATLSTITAADLMRKSFPEPRYAVPGVFSEGLNLFVGPPKIGKSWFSLNAAAAIAHGGMALGKIPVDAGDVLYLALEDTQRRLQERLRMALQGASAPDRLHISTEAKTLADGGVAIIAAWLADHSDARLVIIDTFQKIRGPVANNQNLYAADYAAAGELKRLADTYGVAVVLVHHTRKASAEDPLDTVSGTNGLAAAADTICVLRKEIGKADATLYIRGRDVPEADHALNFDPANCTWTLLGDASEYRMSEERRQIRDLLRDAGEPLSPKRIAEALDKKDGAVRKLLHTMVKAGEVDGLGGLYRLPVMPGEGGTGPAEDIFAEASDWVVVS